MDPVDPASASAPPARLRVAHCSDLHLLSLAGARWLDFANKRWIGGLNLLANRGRHHRSDIFVSMIDDLNAGQADHLLVTGDLTNLALPDEFRFARELFDRLALGPERVTVIPGNHDTYVADGARHFVDRFAPYFASDAGWAWPDGGPWPTVRVRGPAAFVGLSTSHQTPWFTAYGRVGAAQLERLRAVLTDPRLAGLCRVVTIHHPPVGGTSHSSIRGLRDRGALAALLAETGAELILHGHEHRDLRGALPGPAGPIPVRGIQSGTYEAARPDLRARYRVFDVEAGGGPPPAPSTRRGDRPPAGSTPARGRVIGERLRVFDPATGRFVAEPDALVAGAPAAAG